jgi:hypothetical protein
VVRKPSSVPTETDTSGSLFSPSGGVDRATKQGFTCDGAALGGGGVADAYANTSSQPSGIAGKGEPRLCTMKMSVPGEA